MPYTIALFTLIRIFFNTSYRMVYPFLSLFSAGLGVDLAGFSAIFAARSLTGVLGPFLAPIADRRGRKTSMLLGLAVFTLGAGLAALWPSYWTYFAALVLTTLGNFIYLPAMQAYLSDRVPYARRGLVMALTETSWSLAFILGIPLAGALISAAGWGSPFGALALLGLASLAVLAVSLPATPPAANQPPDLWHMLRRVLSHRPVLFILLTSFCITTANECVNLVFGLWIEQSFNLQLASLAAASVVIGLSELGGESFSAGLVDRLGKERSVAAGLLLSALSALALPYLGQSQAGALAGLFFFYLTFEFTIVSELPLVSEVLPEARATLMGANVAAFSLGRMTASLIAPTLFGLGFQVNTLAALVLNLLALAALRFVRIQGRG